MNLNLIIWLFTLLLSASTNEENSKLPDLELKTFEGETINIKEYTQLENIQLISLWATWCGPCRLELNALKEVYPKWKSNYNVEIIAISLDTPRNLARAEKMVKSYSWDFTLFHDAAGELSSKLGVMGIPYSMLVDQSGTIVSSSAGYYRGYETDMESKIKSLYNKKSN